MYFRIPHFAKAFTGLLVLLTFQQLPGQISLSDSLKQVIEAMPMDSTRASADLEAFRMTFYNDFEFARTRAQEAIVIGDSLGIPIIAGEAHRFMGISYLTLGAKRLALDEYQKAYEIFNAAGIQKNTFAALINISTVYIQLEEYEKALELLNKAEMLHRTHTAIGASKVAIYHNKAIVLDMMEKSEESLELFQQALELYEGKEQKWESSSIYLSLGEVYYKLERYEESLENLRKAYQIKMSLGDIKGASATQTTISKAHLSLGRVDSAGYYAHAALEKAEEVGVGSIFIAAYEALTDYHEAAGDLAKSLEYVRLRNTLKDSLEKTDRAELVLNLAKAYESERKEDLIETLEEEKQEQDDNISRQRFYITLLFLGLGGLLLLGIILFLGYRNREKNRLRLQDLLDEIREKNEAISLKNAALEAASQEQKSLLHMIIHDLKSPHTSIAGLIMMLRMISREERAAEVIDRMEAANKRGMHLIQDLLELYQEEDQRGDLPMSEVNVSEVIHQASLAHSGHAERKGIALQFDLAEAGTTIQTNSGVVTRILDNLLSNALKFSGSGTSVTIRCWRDGQKVLFSVADQGPGIAQENIPRLFDKFSRLSAKPTGGESSSGLGMAIVKILTEKVRGTISVDSTLGKGTTFTIELPAG